MTTIAQNFQEAATNFWQSHPEALCRLSANDFHDVFGHILGTHYYNKWVSSNYNVSEMVKYLSSQKDMSSKFFKLLNSIKL